MQTRNIVQIRSHAQKYLIKICKNYSIKLSKKKFLNKKSTHLEWSEKDKVKHKLDPSQMDQYDRNIVNMFKYYDRDYPEEKLSLSQRSSEISPVAEMQERPSSKENTNIHFINTVSGSQFSETTYQRNQQQVELQADRPKLNELVNIQSPQTESKRLTPPENHDKIDSTTLFSLLKLLSANAVILKNTITDLGRTYSLSEKILLLKLFGGLATSECLKSLKSKIVPNCLNILNDLEKSFYLTKKFFENEKCLLEQQFIQFLVKIYNLD